MSDLFTPDGGKIRLGQLVGRGGEGEVYAIAGTTDRLVKRYTAKDIASREAKVHRMIAVELHRKTTLIAFPIASLRDGRGKFAGFTMTRVNGHQPLHELYSPGARKAAFPAASYKFLVRAASNVARVMGAAHATGCVIGDINHSGVLISKNATAALIDADSFQITDGNIIHFCKVGVPEYTPPELQGQSLNNLPRTPTHDEFGLAVVIFQLLWMGRHPYSGRFPGGEMPIDRAIREFRFVYSRERNVGMAPPPAVPSLKSVPPPMAQAFELAFGHRGPQGRPSASQWIALLAEFERSLKTCERNKLHEYSDASDHCAWCHMEQAQRVLLFLPPFVTSDQAAALSLETLGRDLDAIWRAIERVQAPPAAPPSPALPRHAWTPSPSLAEAQQKAQTRKVAGGAIALAGLIALLTAPVAWLLWIPAIWFGVAQLWHPTGGPDDELIRRYREVETQWQKALHDWRERCEAGPFETFKVSLRQMKTEMQDLPNAERAKIEAYHRNRRATQLDTFLDGFQIRRVKISGIGPSRLATLTSYGIETAADVTQGHVLNVPGFGPATSKPLLAWRRQLEARFVFNATTTAADTAAINLIRTETATRYRELLDRLRTGAQKLSQLAIDIRARQHAPDPALASIHRQREQLLGDLRVVGITPPTVYVPPPPKHRAPTPAAPTWNAPGGGQGAKNCPRCGSRMILRTARRGSNAGSRFYGCSRYPTCRGMRHHP